MEKLGVAPLDVKPTDSGNEPLSRGVAMFMVSKPPIMGGSGPGLKETFALSASAGIARSLCITTTTSVTGS